MASVYFDPAVGGDGSTVTDDSNPTTGLANGGHRARFVPALAQAVVISANAVASATSASSASNTATTKAGEAQGHATAASGSATSAQDWATKLAAPVSGGEYSAKYHAQAAASSASSAATSAGYASTFLPSQPGNAGKFLTTDGTGPSWASPFPAGMVSVFAGGTAPAGWLICNGSTVSRTTYAALFAAIGTTYGAGDGSTTFKLPDLRGEFVRGLDGGRGVDSGRALGSAQSSANLSHSHGGAAASDGSHSHTSYGWLNISGGSGPAGGMPQLESVGASASVSNHPTTTNGSHSHSISADGGSESRPRNVAMNYIIKI